jgi:hypothetical protein
MAHDQEHTTGTAGALQLWSGAGAALSHNPCVWPALYARAAGTREGSAPWSISLSSRLVSVMTPGIPVFWDAGRHRPPHYRELVASFLSCRCYSYGPRWKGRGAYEGGALGTMRRLSWHNVGQACACSPWCVARMLPIRRPQGHLFSQATSIRRFLRACSEVTLQREEREKPWCLTDNALPCDTPQLAAGRLHWLAEIFTTRNQFYQMRASLCQSPAR